MTNNEARIGRMWIPVALVATICFANAIKNDLVYDANFLVRANATFSEARQEGGVAGVLAVGKVFKESFWDGVNRGLNDPSRAVEGQALYRPMMMATLGVIYVVAGDKPIAFNTVNIAFHVIASVLVLLLALRLSRDRRVGIIAGLLFASHPIHAEAVAYVAGLGETQALVFSLLSIVLYMSAVTKEKTSRGLLALSALCFASALFTKESSAVLLVLLPLLDVARRSEAPSMKARLGAYAPFLVILGLNIFVRISVCGTLSPDGSKISEIDNPLINADFMTRLATGVTLYARALWMFLLPIGQSADYSFDQLPMARSLAEPAAWSAFLLVAILTIAGFGGLKRRPTLSFGLLTFLFAFGPVSNIPVGIGTIFGERLLYFPSVGLCLAAAVALAALLSACQAKGDVPVRITRALLIAALFVGGFMTIDRNKAYASDEVLYKNMVETAPDSARAHYQRGEVERKLYYDAGRGDLVLAVNSFREAIRIRPDFHLAWIQLGRAYAENGEYQEALDTFQLIRNAIPETERMNALRRQIDLQIRQVHARMSTGTGDPAAIMETLRQLTELLEDQHKNDPDNLSYVAELAQHYLRLNRIDDARRLLEPAVLSSGDSPVLQSLVTSVYAKSGEIELARAILPKLIASDHVESQKVGILYTGILTSLDAQQAATGGDENRAQSLYQEAITYLDRLIEMIEKQPNVAPDDAEAYFARGQIKQDGFQDYEAALLDYRSTVQNNPGHVDAPYRVGECLVALGHFGGPTEAYFEELRKIHPGNGHLLVGYARVLSALGKHRKAADIALEAVHLGINSVGTHTFRAKELMDAELPEQALAALDEAEQMLPIDHPDLHNFRGSAYIELKRYDDALTEFQTMETLSRQSPEMQGFMLQAMFQQAKTRLRIEGRELEGADALRQLDKQLGNALNIAKDKLTRRSFLQQRVYVQRQLAWGHLFAAPMIDHLAAVKALEKASQLCEDNDFTVILRDDILPDLIIALETSGKDADDVRDQMEELSTTKR